MHCAAKHYRICLWRHHLSTSLLRSLPRLPVVPHFSSEIVEWAKRERAWKSPHASRLFSRGVIFTSARVRSLYYPRGKMGDYSKSSLFGEDTVVLYLHSCDLNTKFDYKFTGTENRRMGTGNGESLKRGMFLNEESLKRGIFWYNGESLKAGTSCKRCHNQGWF